MAKYKVVNQPVEVRGTLRSPGAILEESEFGPAPEQTQESKDAGEQAPLDELHSLLSTGHIVEYTDETV